MNGTVNSAEKRIDTLTSAVASVAKSHPAFYVGEAGSTSTDKALTKLFTQQLSQAGVRSVPFDGSDPRACVRVVAGGVGAADARPAPWSRRWG